MTTYYVRYEIEGEVEIHSDESFVLQDAWDWVGSNIYKHRPHDKVKYVVYDERGRAISGQ